MIIFMVDNMTYWNGNGKYENENKIIRDKYVPSEGVRLTGHFYKLTNKGKKAIKEYEMTPMSKEILDKRRRTIEYNKKLNERVRV